MQVVMLKNRTAAPDGVRVNRYLRGETYTVSKELAAAWISEGAALDPADAVRKPPSVQMAEAADRLAPKHSKPAQPQRRKKQGKR